MPTEQDDMQQDGNRQATRVKNRDGLELKVDPNLHSIFVREDGELIGSITGQELKKVVRDE